jgi:methylmalonyl-CoA/ethylmalonyl-CoA epimerase
MIKRIDHVAIAVADLEAAVALFEKILGRKVSRRELVSGQSVETAAFDMDGTSIELIEGKGEDSTVRKFVAKRGPGLHHIALVVDDIGRALSDLEAKGLKPVDPTPKPGQGGSRVAFLLPESTSKVLIELVEKEPGE